MANCSSKVCIYTDILKEELGRETFLVLVKEYMTYAFRSQFSSSTIKELWTFMSEFAKETWNLPQIHKNLWFVKWYPFRDHLYTCKWYPPIVRVVSTPTSLVLNNISHCLHRNNSTQESTSSFLSLLRIASLCKENVYVAVSKCFTLTKSELWKKNMSIYFNWENE